MADLYPGMREDHVLGSRKKSVVGVRVADRGVMNGARVQCDEQVGGADGFWGVLSVSEHAVLFLQESDIKWASRWDTYLTMSDVQIHWFSIINSVVVVFFLSGE